VIDALPEDFSPAEISELLQYARPEERAWLEETLTQAAPAQEKRRALMDFIPETTPGLAAPRHLKPIGDWIEEATKHMGTSSLGLEAVAATPPQHGKTTMLLHSLAWLMEDLPYRHIYATYNLGRTREMSKAFEQIAKRAELPIDGNLALWTNTQTGAEVKFSSVDGGDTTGRPCDGLLIVDDPFAGLAEARSPVYRQGADTWYQGTATTRMHPGASKLIVATRWDIDDLSGRKIKAGWKYMNLQAFRDAQETKPLWPEGHPLEFLRKQRDSMLPSVWAALYMGQPVRDEARVFGDTHHYVKLPKGMRIAIGVDLAYTKKTSADWSVAVVLGEYNARWYVLEVIRLQTTADKFKTILERLQAKYPGAPTRWYTSTTEQGTADVLRAIGVSIYGFHTHGDKVVRATPASLAWNRGHIFLPDQKARNADGGQLFKAPWYDPFVTCVSNFTGHDDPQDDDVDALAAAFDQLPPTAVVDLPPYGSPEWHRAEVARMREEESQRVLRQRQQEEEDQWPT
jgi:predicted phage terminase large subunit-like protein